MQNKLPHGFILETLTKNFFMDFHSSDEMPGYQRVAPDYVRYVLTDPSQRTNIPDSVIAAETQQFVQLHMPHLSNTNSIIGNITCLASFLSDNGFLLDFAPDFVPNNKRIIVQAAGWAMKFVPTFGSLLASLATGKLTVTPPEFSISIPGRLIIPSSSPAISNPYIWIVIGFLCVVFLGATIACYFYCCKKRCSGYGQVI